MLKALIFDFDGLILDTETTEWQAWQEVCQDYNVELTLETWLPCVGTGATTQVFSPFEYLQSQIGSELDEAAVKERTRSRNLELIAQNTILPGVQELILDARQQGLRLAVASSASREWVVGNLERLGLLTYFDNMACGTEAGRTKPHPDLYLRALELLDVQPSQGIAFEDSLNGLKAAKSAGLFGVAVPNLVTQSLDFSQADLRLNSLAEFSLSDWLTRF